MQMSITLLHSERPKLYGVLAVLSAVGLNLLQISIKSLIIVHSDVKQKKKHKRHPLQPTHKRPVYHSNSEGEVKAKYGDRLVLSVKESELQQEPENHASMLKR